MSTYQQLSERELLLYGFFVKYLQYREYYEPYRRSDELYLSHDVFDQLFLLNLRVWQQCKGKDRGGSNQAGGLYLFESRSIRILKKVLIIQHRKILNALYYEFLDQYYQNPKQYFSYEKDSFFFLQTSLIAESDAKLPVVKATYLHKQLYFISEIPAVGVWKLTGSIEERIFRMLASLPARELQLLVCLFSIKEWKNVRGLWPAIWDTIMKQNVDTSFLQLEKKREFFFRNIKEKMRAICRNKKIEAITFLRHKNEKKKK